jgi:hypothetical protein
MSTIWTWYNPWEAISHRSGPGGWSDERSYIISAPESLQRVILRWEATGVDGQNISTSNGGYTGGLIVVRLSMFSDTVNESLALVSRGVLNTITQAGPAEGTSLWTVCYATHNPIELDIQVHRSAEVPPASPLTLDLTYSYGAYAAGVNASMNPVQWWTGNFDLRYLTSQPGVGP